MKDNYDDIMYLKHPTSKKHPRMPLKDRASQFLPFAALNGHNEAILEEARLTQTRVVLQEDAIKAIDEQLNNLKQRDFIDEVSITYFVNDERKSGGAYIEKSGYIKRIDDIKRMIIFRDGIQVLIKDIYAIDSDGD